MPYVQREIRFVLLFVDCCFRYHAYTFIIPLIKYINENIQYNTMRIKNVYTVISKFFSIICTPNTTTAYRLVAETVVYL